MVVFSRENEEELSNHQILRGFQFFRTNHRPNGRTVARFSNWICNERINRMSEQAGDSEAPSSLGHGLQTWHSWCYQLAKCWFMDVYGMLKKKTECRRGLKDWFLQERFFWPEPCLWTTTKWYQKLKKDEKGRIKCSRRRNKPRLLVWPRCVCVSCVWVCHFSKEQIEDINHSKINEFKTQAHVRISSWFVKMDVNFRYTTPHYPPAIVMKKTFNICANMKGSPASQASQASAFCQVLRAVLQQLLLRVLDKNKRVQEAMGQDFWKVGGLQSSSAVSILSMFRQIICLFSQVSLSHLLYWNYVLLFFRISPPSLDVAPAPVLSLKDVEEGSWFDFPCHH